MWKYNGIEITSISQIPKNAIGFIYLIEFVDSMKYIGKKNLYSTKIIKSLKSGKARPNTINFIFKNTGKGFRQKYDVIKTESDWLTYQGSHIDCKNRIVKNKYILQYAYNKLELTYLEAKALFNNEVLEKDEYLNDNILGSFFKGKLYGKTNEFNESY